MPDRLRVFLVDDHAVVRRGLTSFLEGEDDLAVVGSAGDGRTALAELAALADAGRPPRVVLMDILMAGLDGIAATREITRRWPEIAVIALTSFLEQDKVRDALAAGASGYLLKDTDADELADAIRAVAAGDVALQPATAKALVGFVRSPRPVPPELTPREREVVLLIAQGNTNQQIANRLGVSERTARTHVSHILTKLGLTSRTQAAMWATRAGLVD